MWVQEVFFNFLEQQITVQALSALTHEDLKDLIPQTGPRVLFTRCWRTWKKEFLPIGSESTYNISSLSVSFIIILSFKDTH